MTTPRARLGASGERLAADYLTRQGHRVLATNVRRREGEIDLITIDTTDGSETIVFVEVKLRRRSRFGAAIEALSPTKQRRMAALAEAYAAEHRELPRQLRVDLVAVDLAADGTLIGVQHLANAVES